MTRRIARTATIGIGIGVGATSRAEMADGAGEVMKRTSGWRSGQGQGTIGLGRRLDLGLDPDRESESGVAGMQTARTGGSEPSERRARSTTRAPGHQIGLLDDDRSASVSIVRFVHVGRRHVAIESMDFLSALSGPQRVKRCTDMTMETKPRRRDCPRSCSAVYKERGPLSRPDIIDRVSRRLVPVPGPDERSRDSA